MRLHFKPWISVFCAWFVVYSLRVYAGVDEDERTSCYLGWIQWTEPFTRYPGYDSSVDVPPLAVAENNQVRITIVDMDWNNYVLAVRARIENLSDQPLVVTCCTDQDTPKLWPSRTADYFLAAAVSPLPPNHYRKAPSEPEDSGGSLVDLFDFGPMDKDEALIFLAVIAAIIVLVLLYFAVKYLVEKYRDHRHARRKDSPARPERIAVAKQYLQPGEWRERTEFFKLDFDPCRFDAFYLSLDNLQLKYIDAPAYPKRIPLQINEALRLRWLEANCLVVTSRERVCRQFPSYREKFPSAWKAFSEKD